MKNLILEKHEVNKRYKEIHIPRGKKKKERKITKKQEDILKLIGNN